jgi:hypothetical protein
MRQTFIRASFFAKSVLIPAFHFLT